MQDKNIEQDSKFSFKKLWEYMGPGWLMSIGYLDPGNLESDLQTGAISGYSLLWLLLWSHLISLVFQLLSAKLGIVTGKHLSELIRQHYSSKLAHTFWICVQLAMIGSDALQVVGTAVALHILLGCPVWLAVLMTLMDIVTCTWIQKKSVHQIEILCVILVSFIASCFWYECFQSKPQIMDIFKGFVPSVPRHTEFQSVAIVGAVVIPHNMFLHSALVSCSKQKREAQFYFSLESGLTLGVSFLVNMAIVIVFAQVFYKETMIHLPGLMDADTVLVKTLGFTAKYVWAVGLLVAGQSSTMTGSLASKYVTEGFFGKVFKKDWHRMALMRILSLIPSLWMTLFALNDLDTMGELLNVLQSVCLPIILIPIMKLNAVIPQEFRLSFGLKTFCWSLIGIIISLNLYLFVYRVESYMMMTTVFIYLLFLLYIIWKPLVLKVDIESFPDDLLLT